MMSPKEQTALIATLTEQAKDDYPGIDEPSFQLGAWKSAYYHLWLESQHAIRRVHQLEESLDRVPQL